MSSNEQMREALRFTKKPVTIDAIQWDGSLDSFHAIRAAFPAMETCALTTNAGSKTITHWRIRTLEDGHVVSPGDWIIRGVKGEFYPCKPDVFDATYCPALTTPAAEVPEAMGDDEIIAIRRVRKAADPTQQWGDTLAFAKALLAARDAQWQSTRLRGGVPEGWKLVPVEPTPEMVEAFQAGFARQIKRRKSYAPAHKMSAEEAGLRAMLQAAPQAPAAALDAGVVRDAEILRYVMDWNTKDFAVCKRVGATGQCWEPIKTTGPIEAAMSAQTGKGGAA